MLLFLLHFMWYWYRAQNPRAQTSIWHKGSGQNITQRRQLSQLVAGLNISILNLPYELSHEDVDSKNNFVHPCSACAAVG